MAAVAAGSRRPSVIAGRARGQSRQCRFQWRASQYPPWRGPYLQAWRQKGKRQSKDGRRPKKASPYPNSHHRQNMINPWRGWAKPEVKLMISPVPVCARAGNELRAVNSNTSKQRDTFIDQSMERKFLRSGGTARRTPHVRTCRYRQVRDACGWDRPSRPLPAARPDRHR